MPNFLRTSLLALAMLTTGHAHTVWDDRTNHADPSEYSFTGAAYGAGRFLMIGYNLSSYYQVSGNGRTNWVTQQWPESLIYPNSVAFGKGLFVMVGDSGSIYTSPTGLTGSWTQRASGMDRDIRCVRFLNNMFVAGTDRYNDAGGNLALSYTEILTSPTGEIWTSHKYPANAATLADTAYTITDIGFKSGTGGTGIWVLGANVTNTCLSANESFTTLTRTSVLAVGGDQRVACGNGMFVITSETGGSGKIWFSSAPLVGWTQAALPAGIAVADMTGVFHDGTRFVASGATVAGSDPPRPALLHSTDGITWTQAATVPSTDGDLQFVARLDGLWMTGGSGKTLLTSGTSSAGLGEIDVESPVSTPLIDAVSTLVFDPVNLGQNAVKTIRVRNTGIENLTGLSITINGAHPGDFTKSALPATLAPGASADFTVTFAPKGGGARTAALHINSNDSDEKPFDINLTGVGIAPPTAKTVAAAIAGLGATLNGTVNAKGSNCDVWFDYGTTAALGTTVEGIPAKLSDGADTAVSVSLPGLASHTKYHYRVRAVGESGGSASGAIMTFTTANTAPIGVMDTFEVTLASTVQLNVLENDLSPDGDALSIASFTALDDKRDGKITKSGNTFIFAASYSFNGATFTYKVKDAFGAISGPITVTLTQGLCGINPAIVFDRPSAAQSYPVTVTTTAMWSASESLPWVTVGPASGTGNGTVTITLQANTGKTERSGTVMIGGYPHDIYQSGVSKPTLEMPSYIPEGIVSGGYELQVPTTNFPVTYTVTNLPPGLTINSTGLISGTPTKGGKYTVTVKAKNAAGSADLSPSFDINILSLPEGLVGTYHGLVHPHPDLNGNLGSRMELTVASTGACSGKFITGTVTLSFKGALTMDVMQPNQARPLITIARKGLPSLTLDGQMDHPARIFNGTLSDGTSDTPVSSWTQDWNATDHRATQYGGLYTFAFSGSDPDPALPKGSGFGSFKISNEATGAVKVAGKMPDGSPFTTTTFVGEDGQILLYQSLYNGKGSFAGALSIGPDAPAPDNQLGNLVDTMWFKQGVFGPYSIGTLGGRLPTLAPGDIILDLPDANNNARITFEEGGLADPVDVTFRILNPKATGVTNTAVIPANPYNLTMPTLNPATGAFGGKITFSLNRTVAYEGMLVLTGSGYQGLGYFLLPESTAANAVKLSGLVRLQSNEK